MSVVPIELDELSNDFCNVISLVRPETLHEKGTSLALTFNKVSLIIEEMTPDTQIDQVINIQKSKKINAIKRVLSNALTAATNGETVRLTVETDALTSPDVIIRKFEA